MSTEQQVTEANWAGLLRSVGEDPLNPRMQEQVAQAVAAGCPASDIAHAVYVGLEGALATYWVALQEGNLRSDDFDFYRVLGMRRFVKTCYDDRKRLLEFANHRSDFFEMLGRTTSWQH